MNVLKSHQGATGSDGAGQPPRLAAMSACKPHWPWIEAQVLTRKGAPLALLHLIGRGTDHY